MIPNGVSASGLDAPNDPSGFWDASMASTPVLMALSICACDQSPGVAAAGAAGRAKASAAPMVQSTRRSDEAFAENTGRSLPPGRRRDTRPLDRTADGAPRPDRLRSSSSLLVTAIGHPDRHFSDRLHGGHRHG